MISCMLTTYFAFSQGQNDTILIDKDFKCYLAEINVKKTKATLLQLFEEEKIYRDPDLNLDGLAMRLGVSRYQLSQLLNTEMKLGFNKWVQRYRIEAAKSLLKTHPHRTILSIAYEVGFNSNSAFQTAFRSWVELTPSAYRDIV